MSYRVVKYKEKKKCPFETYEPKRKRGLNKENTVPFLFKMGHEFSSLGGLIGFWVSGVLMAIKSFFGIKKKVENFSFNKKTVEIRVKKK